MRDAVIAVHIDAEGNIRSQTKFDGLRITKEKDTPEYKAQAKDREAFLGIFRRTDGRKRTHAPAVVVVGGMSVRAMQLKKDLADCLREKAIDELGQAEPTMDNYPLPEQLQQAQDMYDAALRPFLTPLIMPNDATARMYMDSDEGKAEHPGLPSNGRYALALARYAQSPLNAYAKMGKRVSDVTFVEHHQRLVSALRMWADGRLLKKSCYCISSALLSMGSANRVSTFGNASRNHIPARCCLLSRVWDRERQTRWSRRLKRM